ncbi:MAG: hypothetical protein KY455_10500 [Euryarchaeota archaeon]|nr:hypothetical protein [Euryarchaeota archaeon]
MKPLVFVLILALAVATLPAASAAPDPTPDREPKDVFLPELVACLWKGSYKVLIDTPVVRVWHYTCDSPDS